MRIAAPITLWSGLALASGPAGAQVADEPGAQTAGQFPRQWTNESGTVVVHAPEIDAWPNFETLEARAAVEVTLAGDDVSTIASIQFTATTETNLDLGLIAIDNIELTAVNMSLMVAPEYAARFEAVIRENLRANPQEIPVEVVLGYISPDATLPTPEGMRLEPPPIFYSMTPAVLLQTDGDPLVAPIPDTQLQFVINTNWDLLKYRDSEWYLLNGSTWLTSESLTGPWEYVRRLPGDFDDLPTDENWAAARAAIPPQRPDGEPPTVLVSDRPAELILLDGEPRAVDIGEAGLMHDAPHRRRRRSIAAGDGGRARSS